MADIFPAWTIMDAKVWSIIRKSFENDVEVRRVQIKYVYRLSTTTDLRGRKLLWLPLKSDVLTPFQAIQGNINCLKIQTKNKFNNFFKDLKLNKEIRDIKSSTKTINSNPKRDTVTKHSSILHPYYGWKEEWIQSVALINNMLAMLKEATFIANLSFPSQVRAYQSKLLKSNYQLSIGEYELCKYRNFKNSILKTPDTTFIMSAIINVAKKL